MLEELTVPLSTLELWEEQNTISPVSSSWPLNLTSLKPAIFAQVLLKATTGFRAAKIRQYLELK